MPIRREMSASDCVIFKPYNLDFDGKTQGVPINPRDLAKLSFADTRRIAALKTQQRLQDLLQKQEALMRKGRWKLTDSSMSHMPTLTPQHMTALHGLWEQMVKFVHCSGVHYLDYLQRHSEKMHVSQRQELPRRARPDFGPRVKQDRKKRASRLLVFHITDILVNLRHRQTLKELVAKKLDLLLGMGFTPSEVQHMSTRTVTYLQHAHPKHWNRIVEHACSIVLKCLRTLGNEHLAGRYPADELFHDPVTNIVYKPGVTF
ncbi:hypothetical protein ElyMa_003891600 [Elysia marginata]|uniref:Uncharacterized protein n=1 Tax=Elysia marginata TaxID=1093978 RepID=A0AAV4FM76_9GAST|nr:hypothetical protein ElyMa_003891600 [Elysia marginata]